MRHASGSTLTNYFYCYDGNHNVRGLVSARDGKTAAECEYDPFGGVIILSGTSASLNDVWFSTKRRDRESEWLLYPRRLHDPSSGRWLNRDPIEELGGNNLYAFALNDFVNHLDPLGLDINRVPNRASCLLPCHDPCGDAKRKKLCGRQNGCVICCEGNKYACALSPGSTAGSNNKTAQKIDMECIKAHEEDHIKFDPTPCPPGILPAPMPPEKEGPGHCSAWLAQLTCLKDSIKDPKNPKGCGNDENCQTQIHKASDALENKMRANGCPIPP